VKYFLIPVLLTAACSASPPPEARYELEFQASDDRGDPVEGLTVAIGETRIGNTDARGLLRAEVNASKGERFPLHAPCPGDYLESDAPGHVVFRDTRGLAGARSTTIRLEIQCARRDRVAALLVHADGQAGMPILIDGLPHGHTGTGGYAHLRLDMQPGEQFEVALDSSDHPKLRPINPRRTMTLGAEDDLFVFDPVFVEVEPPKKKRRRRKKKVEEPVIVKKRPIRID
jgi:hypothetical protein